MHTGQSPRYVSASRNPGQNVWEFWQLQVLRVPYTTIFPCRQEIHSVLMFSWQQWGKKENEWAMISGELINTIFWELAKERRWGEFENKQTYLMVTKWLKRSFHPGLTYLLPLGEKTTSVWHNQMPWHRELSQQNSSPSQALKWVMSHQGKKMHLRGTGELAWR